jgi:hypothetical protein
MWTLARVAYDAMLILGYGGTSHCADHLRAKVSPPSLEISFSASSQTCVCVHMHMYMYIPGAPFRGIKYHVAFVSVWNNQSFEKKIWQKAKCETMVVRTCYIA